MMPQGQHMMPPQMMPQGQHMMPPQMMPPGQHMMPPQMMMPGPQMMPGAMAGLAEMPMPSETPPPSMEGAEEPGAWTYEDEGPGPGEEPYVMDSGYGVEPPDPRATAVRRAKVIGVLVGALAATLAMVHFAIVPLEVLAVWRVPARLEVESSPSGAEVFIDGRRLSARTPTFIDVQRDTSSHVIELRMEGFRNEQQTVSYSKTVRLAVSMRLQPVGNPGVEAELPQPATRSGRTPPAPDPTRPPPTP
jgi:hypothetical protein